MINNIKIIFFCIFIITCNNIFAETSNIEPTQDPSVPYRLFRTENFWTFIELNTITGQMWQIHFDIEGDNRGALILNLEDLSNNKKKIPGRFTLYPTANMFTFILADQIDGITWQVQWSFEENERFILLISN